MLEKQPFRVLQVVTVMDCGGLENFIMNMYRNIDRSKIQFDFLTHRATPGFFDEEIRDLGGSIFHVPRANPLSAKYYKALDDFFSSHTYPVVHSHIDCMSAFPLRAAAKSGSAVRIAHSHSSHQERDLKYPLKMLCKPFIKKEATHLFACGTDAGKWMFNTDDFEVVHNAVDVSKYGYSVSERALVREELGIGENELVIGHVGRFSPTKNHSFILDVFKELLAVDPGAWLVLVGDGDLRLQIQQKAAELGIDSRVKFLGIRSDVWRIMQAMDLFLMPSVFEGLPLVLVEAQASGLPCAISDSIPNDCDLSKNTVTRLSLNEPPESWVERIMLALRSNLDRGSGIEIVRKAGFDASVEAKKLEQFYLSAEGSDCACS